MKLPKYKVIFRYKNITLWRNNLILKNKFSKQKWTDLNNKKLRRYYLGNAFYICHYKKLKLERLYSFKFMNKQILKKYLVNYKEYNFKKNILTKNYLNFERRLDFNIYKAHFAESLYAARFYIVKGFVLVNGKIITSFNYLLNDNDKIEINKIFFNFIYNKINFDKINNLYYLRNLEIDYKTLSFIFLNNQKYYIINYQNFLKRIYCIRYHNKNSVLKHKYYKKVFHNNELKLRRYNFQNNYYRKNYKLNNYFRFFDYIFRYYLFLDKKHRIIKKRYNKYFLTNYELKILFKVFKKKYTNYFFRNILLKRTFNYKYNYLKLIQSNLLNFKNFENINYSLYKNNNIELNNTSLINQYFKYYYNLIFKFYIYLLKNYYISSYTLNLSNKYSINNYNYKIILSDKLFKIMNLKNKLNYFYISNFNTYNNNNIQKYKHIKYKSIKRNVSKIMINRRKKEYYISKNKYKDFLNYIYSQNFKLKFHRYYWNDCRAKSKKRRYICNKLYTSFCYKYYNISKIGVDRPYYSKHFIYNRLVFNFKNTKIYRFNKKNLYNYYRFNVRYLKNKRLYYSISSDIYKYVFYNVIKTSLNEKSKIHNNFYILLSLIKKLELNNSDYSNILEDLQKKYNILLKNRKLKNLNYNINIKNLYLISNLIKYYKKDIYNLNLNHNVFNVLYKNNLKRNEYRFVNYSLFIFRKNRFVLEPLEKRTSFYISYNKPKLYLSGNIRKYLINYSYKNSKIKSIYKQLYIYNNYYRFKRIKKYLYKNNKNILQNKFKNNYLFNLNIIDSNLKFNDNLFFIDLFINFNVRKLNKLYNSINYTKINKYNLYKNYKNDINIKLKYINNYELKIKNNYKKSKIKFYTYILNNTNYNINKYRSIDKLKSNSIIKKYTYIYNYNTYVASINNSKYIYNYFKSKNYTKSSKYFKKHNKIYIKRKLRKFKYRYGLYFIKFKKYNHTNIKYKLYNFSKKNIYDNVNNIYKIYIYYSVYYKKYKLIKYLFNNYIFKEYAYILDKLISKNLNIKTYDENYIKQLYYNLLYSKFFNFKIYDNILYNNFKYNRNLKILINYFILIKRFYK